MAHQSHVFYSSVLQCYGSLHVLRYFVHWNWCITAMCSTVVCCGSIVFFRSVSADCNGMAASRCLERYLFSSSVLRLYCVLQVIVGRSQWNCYIMDAVWILGFARNIVFFFRIPLRRKVGSRARRFRAWLESCPNGARNVTEGFRWLFLFLVDAVPLRFACVETLCALELVHQRDVFHSSVLQFYCVSQVGLCRSRWNGCVKVPRCCGCMRNTIVVCNWES